MRRRRRWVPWAVAAVCVVVVVALGLWRRHTGPPGSRQRPTVASARERQVVALWYSGPGEREASGVSYVTARVEPPRNGGVEVGIYETEAEGTGPTWRAAAWMAAVTASLETGLSLEEYVPSFTVDGRIDGPSAGALLALGLMSALREEQLLPASTITGVIGPDGSVGPVGGVPEKIEAAGQNGYSLVLVPQGQLHYQDPETGDVIDVASLGATEGVTVEGVGTIRQAYERLTGISLPPLPDVHEHPALPPEVEERLRAGAQEWLTRHADELARWESLQGRLRGTADPGTVLDSARRTAARARTSLDAGHMASAYDLAVTSTLQAAVPAEFAAALTLFQSGGLAAVAEPLEETRTEQIVETGQRLASAGAGADYQPLADALGVLAQAAGLELAAGGLAEQLRGTAPEVLPLGLLQKSAVVQAMRRHAPQIAEDRMLLLTGGDQAQHPVEVGPWARTMERGATANLAYFEAVTLDDAARQQGIHPDTFRLMMEAQDLTYLMAQASMVALPDLEERLPYGHAPDLCALGASVGAYATASALVAKFYALGVRISEDGDLVGVRDEAALERMLTSSAARARSYVRLAEDAGVPTAVPAYYYLVAQRYADQGQLEKLEALQGYWQCSLYARLSVLIAEDAQR